jgi:site-specific recombinase XerD
MHTAIRLFSKSEEIRLRDELMIEIPRETWLRKSEIVRCKFKDFHNENRQFKVLVKWNKYESVFFSEKLQNKVFKYESLLNAKYPHLDIEKLFICLWQKEKWKEISSHLLWKHFLLIVKRMKKEWMIPMNKQLCLHQERHSFAMRCVYSWLSQQATTRLMRHSDPKITLHYYHMNDTRLLNQYDRICS